jgi:hypothetical protein
MLTDCEGTASMLRMWACAKRAARHQEQPKPFPRAHALRDARSSLHMPDVHTIPTVGVRVRASPPHHSDLASASQMPQQKLGKCLNGCAAARPSGSAGMHRPRAPRRARAPPRRPLQRRCRRQRSRGRRRRPPLPQRREPARGRAHAALRQLLKKCASLQRRWTTPVWDRMPTVRSARGKRMP